MADASTKARRESWSVLAAKPRQTKRVRLDAAFAGIPAGSMLFVGTPDVVAQYIDRVPRGETRSIERMRRDIARSHRCDAMCPVSTAIFLRMVAERAWDELQSGAAPEQVTPFWRVIEPGSTIAKKLRADSTWLSHQRELEAVGAER